MRRSTRISLLFAIFALLAPARALATTQTLTLRAGPFAIGPYAVAQGAVPAPSPSLDGYVTAMDASIVDAAGNPVSPLDVMLHHVVFGKVLTPDSTCSGGFTDYDGRQSSFPVERFYAMGEERAQLHLPAGYGYPNRGSDVWGFLYMLMNHHAHAMSVYVQYTVRYVTGERLTPVRPFWFDVRNCLADPVWSIPGTGGRASLSSRSADFRMPVSGRFVAGSGHLHGGGSSLELSNVTCGNSPLFASYPTWGAMEPKPVMHEPGPLSMSGFTEAPGRSVRAGDLVRITARYDNSRPHVRVMGIMLLYLAEEPVDACASFESPKPPPSTADAVAIELLKKPTGRVARDIRSTWVADYAFGAQRISLRRGTAFTWRFAGPARHDVTLATGPEGFASPSMSRGTFRFRFTRPGTYRLFCSLHPSRMTQIVTVRRN